MISVVFYFNKNSFHRSTTKVLDVNSSTVKKIDSNFVESWKDSYRTPCVCSHLSRAFYSSPISVLFLLSELHVAVVLINPLSFSLSLSFDQYVHLVLAISTSCAWTRRRRRPVLDSFLRASSFPRPLDSFRSRQPVVSAGPALVVHTVRRNNCRFHKSERVREKVPYSPDLPS